MSRMKLALAFVCFAVALFGQAVPKDGEWPTYGGDLRSDRYKPFDQINAANFGKL
jgi:glucose dehydrogenase